MWGSRGENRTYEGNSYSNLTRLKKGGTKEDERRGRERDVHDKMDRTCERQKKGERGHLVTPSAPTRAPPPSSSLQADKGTEGWSPRTKKEGSTPPPDTPTSAP